MSKENPRSRQSRLVKDGWLVKDCRPVKDLRTDRHFVLRMLERRPSRRKLLAQQETLAVVIEDGQPQRICLAFFQNSLTL